MAQASRRGGNTGKNQRPTTDKKASSQVLVFLWFVIIIRVFFNFGV